MASAVCTPWPISLRGMASTTEPSAAILIQPLSTTPVNSGAPAPALACQGRAALPSRERASSTLQPMTSAPAAPAALNNQVLLFMRWPSRPSR